MWGEWGGTQPAAGYDDLQRVFRRVALASARPDGDRDGPRGSGSTGSLVNTPGIGAEKSSGPTNRVKRGGNGAEDRCETVGEGAGAGQDSGRHGKAMVPDDRPLGQEPRIENSVTCPCFVQRVSALYVEAL